MEFLLLLKDIINWPGRRNTTFHRARERALIFFKINCTWGGNNKYL